MRTLGIIPARAGSKRLPGKNMRLLNGKPLVQWVIEAAERSERVSQIVVSSDDPEVLKLAGSYGLARPSHMARDDSPAIDYVRHALSALQSAFDAVAIIQPTSPFTTAEDIDGTIAMLEQTGADSVVTVCEVPFMYRPCKQLIAAHECRALNAGFGSAHDGERLYVRNCSVYATRISSIQQGKVIGDDCRGYLMPRERSIDINDLSDLEFARFLASRK